MAQQVLSGEELPLKLAYLVARFPKVTETFVARELNAVAADPRIEASLFSLFPAPPHTTVHASAEPWLDRNHPATPRASLSALGRWVRRRPLRTVGSLARLTAGFARRPRLLPASLAAFAAGCAHAETMEAEGIEHVHAHFMGNPGTAAWTIHRLTGIGYSATIHAYELFQDRAFLRPRVDEARFVVTISDFNGRLLHELCPSTPTPVHIIRVGVDLTKFRYRERLVHENPVRAITVGSLMSHKGHRVLISALAAEDLSGVELEIVGDGAEREALEQLADTLGVSKRVRFLGSMSEDRVVDSLEHSDVFVSPSVISDTGRMEGVPVVLMEALASGLPAIATRISGVPELIRPHTTGLLAEQNDVEDLRAALREFIGDPEGARVRAREGRALVEREFDVIRSAARLADLFVATRA